MNDIKKTTIKVGNQEAKKLRVAMKEIAITQDQLAEVTGISPRYMRTILSVNKQKDVSVNKKILQKIEQNLNVNQNSIFIDTTLKEYQEDDYLFKIVKTWMNRLLFKNLQATDYKYCSNNKTLKKTNRFGNTIIIHR